MSDLEPTVRIYDGHMIIDLSKLKAGTVIENSRVRELVKETEEFLDLLDGLHAYDEGSLQSGIHDDVRREEAATIVGAMTEDQKKQIANYLYSDARGYAEEDRQDFLDWIRRDLL